MICSEFLAVHLDHGHGADRVRPALRLHHHGVTGNGARALQPFHPRRHGGARNAQLRRQFGDRHAPFGPQQGDQPIVEIVEACTICHF
jgi:hypothetical protein